MTNFLSFLLNIVISFLFVLLFNIVFSGINLHIGINPASIGIITFLGFPGIVPLALAAILI